MQIRLNAWVLAALLVLSQSALLLHQSDIDAHSDGKPCSVCLLAHGLDNALASQPVLHGDSAPHTALTASRHSFNYRCPTGSSYRTRAPPQHTFLG